MINLLVDVLVIPALLNLVEIRIKDDHPFINECYDSVYSNLNAVPEQLLFITFYIFCANSP